MVAWGEERSSGVKTPRTATVTTAAITRNTAVPAIHTIGRLYQCRRSSAPALSRNPPDEAPADDNPPDETPLPRRGALAVPAPPACELGTRPVAPGKLGALGYPGGVGVRS